MRVEVREGDVVWWLVLVGVLPCLSLHWYCMAAEVEWRGALGVKTEARSGMTAVGEVDW